MLTRLFSIEPGGLCTSRDCGSKTVLMFVLIINGDVCTYTEGMYRNLFALINRTVYHLCWNLLQSFYLKFQFLLNITAMRRQFDRAFRASTHLHEVLLHVKQILLTCFIWQHRFDYIDKPGVGNTDIIIRSLHDISEGAEVCISYFPINWRFAERQRKLNEEYGFECKCERCKIEEGWSDEDTAEQNDDISVEGEGSEGDEDMENTEEEVMDAEGDTQGSFPHAMFFVKYLCPNESCGGTLAPLPPVEGVISVMECNVCGQLRSEDDFLQEIQEHRVSS